MRALLSCTLFLCLVLGQPNAHAAETSRIGIDTASLANPFFQAMVRAVLQTAKRHNPEVEVITLQHEYDSRREAANIRSLIQRDVQLLILSAASDPGLTPLLDDARRRGIVVIAVDVAVTGAHASVMTNNRLAGEMTCRHLAQALGGKGKVAIQRGPAVSTVLERVQGCRSALAAFPHLTVVNEEIDGLASPIGGLQATQALLERHPDVAGLFTINDRQALGSDSALRQAGRQNVLIASVDGSPEFVEALPRSPNLLVSATQDPFRLAERAVEIGLAIRAGQPAPLVPERLTPGLLTRANLPHYPGWQSRP